MKRVLLIVISRLFQANQDIWSPYLLVMLSDPYTVGETESQGEAQSWDGMQGSLLPHPPVLGKSQNSSSEWVELVVEGLQLSGRNGRDCFNPKFLLGKYQHFWAGY